MSWAQRLANLELSLRAGLDANAVFAAAGIAAAAFAVGWIAGQRLDAMLGPKFPDLFSTPDTHRRQFKTILSATVSSLLLLLALNASLVGVTGQTILAAATGVAIGRLAYSLARCFGLARVVALVLASIVAVITMTAAFGGMQPLTEALDAVGLSFGKHRLSLLSLITAIIVVAVLLAAVRIANRLVATTIRRASGFDPAQRVLVEKLAGIVLVVLAVLLGLDLLGIDLTALTVFSGALGLAVGFGLQKTLGNLIAGLILLMDRSIKPGDVIVVGDTFGAVNKIGVRAVSVVTRDGKEHLIPNEQLMTEPVENWSYSSRNVRLHIPVGVAYSSDIAVAQRLMIEAATQAARVLPEPAPSVWLKGFGDSSVDHDILVWIADPELGVGNVRSDILNRVWKLFSENAIEIPFPQRDIHVRSLPKRDGGTRRDNQEAAD